MRIHIEFFITKRADKDFFVLFLILWTTMRLDGTMIGTVDLFAVFTSDWEPVFLFACVKSAMFSYVLIEHFEIFLSL